MKKYIFLLVFFCGFVKSFSFIIPIPDINFKNALLQADVTNGTAGIGFIYLNLSNLTQVKIDTNDNNEIDDNEALMIDFLSIATHSITNLSGIEYFTNLKCLNCAQNLLTNIDVLNNLNNVVVIDCSYNTLTSISFNNFQNLISFGCYFNQITSITLNNLPNLEIVGCNDNRITSVTLNNLPSLEYFDCSNNRITSLTTSGLPLLQNFICPNNRLVNLDFSNAPSLTQLNCGTNRLVSVNIQNGALHQFVPSTDCWFNNPNLTNICDDPSEVQPLEDFLVSCGMINQTIDVNSNCGLGVQENSYSNITISPNPSNGIFNIGLKNNYQTFQVFDLLGKCILKQSIDNQTQVKVDLSSFVSGYYMATFISNNETITIKLLKN